MEDRFSLLEAAGARREYIGRELTYGSVVTIKEPAAIAALVDLDGVRTSRSSCPVRLTPCRALSASISRNLIAADRSPWRRKSRPS
jgi:hypothetical protein